MLGDDFQTRHATVMDSMLKSAVAETTKLFETMVDELKAELSRIRKENEDLKSKYNDFENAKHLKVSCKEGSGPETGPSSTRDKRDHGVQCDIVPMQATLVEQFIGPHQSRNLTMQSQEQQVHDEMNVGLEREQHCETHGEGKASVAFVLVKQEGSDCDSSFPLYMLLEQEDEVSTVACRYVLHEIPDLPGAFISCITPEESPNNQPSSHGGVTLLQNNQGAPKSSCSTCDSRLSCERGDQIQVPEPEQPPVVTCPAREDDTEEQCEVTKQTSKTFAMSEAVELPILDEDRPLFNAEQQLIIRHPEKEQPSAINQQLRRENETLGNEEIVTMQRYVDVPSTIKPLSEAAALSTAAYFPEWEVGLVEVEVSSQPDPATSHRSGRPPKTLCESHQQPQDKMAQLPTSDVPMHQKVISLSSGWKESEVTFLTLATSLPRGGGHSPKKDGVSQLPEQNSVPPPSIDLPSVRMAISTPLREVKDIEVSSQPSSSASPKRESFKEKLSVEMGVEVIETPSGQASSGIEAVEALSAESTKKQSGRLREQHHSHPTLQEAMLLVEAINALKGDTFSSPQIEPAPTQTKRSPSLVTSQITSMTSSQAFPLRSSQTPPKSPLLPVPTVNNQATVGLPTVEQTATPLSSVQQLPVTTQTTVLPLQQSTAVSQALMKTFIIPTVITPKQTSSSIVLSDGAMQTGVQSQQRCPPLPRMIVVAPRKELNYPPPKIMAMPRQISSFAPYTLAALSPAQLSTILSTVVTANKYSLSQASTSTSLSITAPCLSTVPLTTVITSKQSLSSVTSQTSCSREQQSMTSSDPEITIVLPQQFSPVVHNQEKFTLASQSVLLTNQKTTTEPSSTIADSSTVSSLTSQQSGVTVATSVPTDKPDLTTSQRWDNISDQLAPVKITETVSKVTTVPTDKKLPSATRLLQAPAPPKIPPVFQEKLTAVVRLTKVPLTASSKKELESCFKTSLLSTKTFSSFNNCPVTGQEQTQVPPMLPLTTKEKTEKTLAVEKSAELSATSTNDTLFSKRSTLSTEVYPIFKSVPFTLHVKASTLQEESNVVNEKHSSVHKSIQPASDASKKEVTPDSKTATLFTETLIKLKESSVIRCVQKVVSTKVSTTVQEKPSAAFKPTGSPATFTNPQILKTLTSSNEASCGLEEVCCSSPVQASMPPILQEKPADSLLRLNSVHVKDVTSDSHSQDISNNVDTITAHTESKNGDSIRLSSDSLVTRRQSPFKSRLQASKTKPRKEPLEEPDSILFDVNKPSAKKRSLVNDLNPGNSSESVYVGSKKIALVEDHSSPNKTTAEQLPLSPKNPGLAKTVVNLENENNQSKFVSLRRLRLTGNGASPKKSNEQISARPKRSTVAKEGVGLIRNTIESICGKKHRLIQDNSSHKRTIRMANTKSLAKAAKLKTLVRIKNSNQPKSKRVDSQQSAKKNPSHDKRKKAKVKALWDPPRLATRKTPLTRGRSSTPTLEKRETRSRNQVQTPAIPQQCSQNAAPHLIMPLNQSPSSPPNRSQTAGPSFSLKGHPSSHRTVYPPSVSVQPIPVRAPPIISPLQPLSVIGRRLLKNQCGECGRVLSSTAALESHVRLHTGQRPFSCTLCGKSFPDSKGFRWHGRVHRNGRIHICSQCGKGFVYRFCLTKHLQMVHARVKPFVCQVCSKGFLTKLDLEAHFRVHTGEKPFHCNLCEKRFKRREDLNVHLRWHNGEKRHWCPYCGKGFLDYNNLKRHKYIHTGEKPHTCSHCPKKFTQSGHLKKHLKNVHKVK